jgi:hypothetical protein
VDAFTYLSVLLGVILGLAITQILQGFRGLLHARERVVIYWPSLVWAGLVLIVAVQSWWAMFGLRQVSDWTFLAFAVVLMENIGIYMLAALVFPDFAEGRRVDLHGTYFRQARWFYGLLVAALMFSMLKDRVVFGAFPTGWNLAFHLVVIAGSFAAAFIRSETFHKAYTVFSALLFLTYIGALFDYLH